MAATITVETGAGLTNSNSYVTLAEANTYFDTHPQASGWTGLASDDIRNRYLITAARVLDACFQFNGFKAVANQAMQWPREGAVDRDGGDSGIRVPGSNTPSGYFDSDSVPQGIKDAQCEMARFLVASNRMDDAPGTGIKEFELPGAIRVAFETGKLQQICPEFVVNMLRRFGTFLNSRSGCVSLGRA